MISRKKILSCSQNDLSCDSGYDQSEEDVWYQKKTLYKDHIMELLGKWQNIDDEIWAKVIVLERNRRVAKAYVRAPVLTVNGGDAGFDGFRIGVNGFDNPKRDPKTTEFKNQIGQGCKIKMDEAGNVLVKRFSKSPIYVKNTIEENAVSNDILKLPNGLLELEKPFKLFDMKKFQQNVNREMKRTYPDRRKLESQCISAIAFVRNEQELLDSPIWIMLINIVALEMLRVKLPAEVNPEISSSKTKGTRHSSEPRKVAFFSGSSDEDPYSLTASGSSGSSRKDQAKNKSGFPMKQQQQQQQMQQQQHVDNSGSRMDHYATQERGSRLLLTETDSETMFAQNWAKNHLRYAYEMNNPNPTDYMSHTLPKKPTSSANQFQLPTARYRQSRKKERVTDKTPQTSSRNDDPYYCGMTARVPNFTPNNNNNYSGAGHGGYMASDTSSRLGGARNRVPPGGPMGMAALRTYPIPSISAPNLQNMAQLPISPVGVHPFWWHSRLYP